MDDNGLKSKFTLNVTYALIAQCCSLAVSILMSLIVPKLLGVEQFAYWQLFIFYVGYVGLFHFGLSDGVYLRYGGTLFKNLDFSAIGSQMRMMIAVHIVISTVVVAISFFISDSSRGLVWIFTAIQLILCNIYWYLGYIFQAANETRVYSIATIIIKTIFILFIFLLVYIKPRNFVPFIIAYLISQFLGTAYILWKGRLFLFAHHLPLKITVRQVFDNCRIGISLTFSNIASSLILGVGRMFVDMGQGLEAFGLVSLALSLTNFFLQFISQISMVMFPALRQIDETKQIEWYTKLRLILSYILCAMLIFYAPAKMLLERWLPQYAQSFAYLGVLLPICVFDGKMQLLYNTYLKVVRKERVLLIVNLIVFGVSCFLSAIGVFFCESVEVVAISQGFAIAIRSIIANVYLNHYLAVPFEVNVIWECGLSVIFIIGNKVLPLIFSWILYLIVMIIYILYSKSYIKEMIYQNKGVD